MEQGMKVRILSDNLTGAVIEAARAIAKRPSLPQAESVLLETIEGRLRVTGSDLETAISVFAGCMVEQEGKALIKAGTLSRALATFPACAIDLNLDGNTLALSSNGRAFNLDGLDPQDYPPVPDASDPIANIDPVSLRRALGRILDCAATDDQRPVLQAINLSESLAPNGDSLGRLRLAAADGFRLGVHEVDTDWQRPLADPFPEMNVPVRTLRELHRLLPKPKDADGPVQVYVGKRADGEPTHVRFALKSQDVTAMLVQGTFPNYSQLIPTGWDTSVKVGTKELRRELQAASVLAAIGNGIVRFTVGPDTLTLAARDEGTGEFASTIPAKTEGDGKIAFDYRYVDAFLKTVDTEAVELRFASPSAPGVLVPVDDGDYQRVIMPMFVNWTAD